METTHTPGPWKATGLDTTTEPCRIVVAATGEELARMSYMGADESDSARLIAAAPDLLAALQDILSRAEAVDTDSVDCLVATMRDIVVNAGAALAKAEGRE